MKLAEHLSLRTPLLWVTTEEPGRVIDRVVAESDHPVFRLDALSGLITWSSERDSWVKVLIENDDGDMLPTKDPGESFQYVLDNRGLMIIENAHAAIEMMAGFFLSVVLEYRGAFYSNDKREVPAQFILLSHQDKIPGEISRMTTHLTHELPNQDELDDVLTHMSSDLQLNETSGLIARAGLGLSETEFISAALVSHREEGSIKAEMVNHAKMELLKKNGVLEVRTPNVGLDDLGGLDKAKELIKQVNWVWNNPEEAEEMEVESLRRIMFVGVPGTGKSLICEAISSNLKLDLAKGGISQAMDKYVGESEKNVRRMFATLKRMAPIVFWIDEFGRDMSGGMSSGSVDGGTTDRAHGEFLTGVQELPDNVFLAAAANRIEELPPEMLRADRFDRIMFVGFPTIEERQAIFKIHLGKHHEDHNLQQLAAATPFFTGAEIKALIREVRFNTVTTFRRPPHTEEIIEFVPQVRGRVWINHRDSIVAMYQRAQEEWVWASSFQQDEANEVLAAAGAKSYAPQQSKKSTPKPEPKVSGSYSGSKGGFQVPKAWGQGS